jgi:hypothetical protein
MTVYISESNVSCLGDHEWIGYEAIVACLRNIEIHLKGPREVIKTWPIGLKQTDILVQIRIWYLPNTKQYICEIRQMVALAVHDKQQRWNYETTDRRTHVPVVLVYVYFSLRVYACKYSNGARFITDSTVVVNCS